MEIVASQLINGMMLSCTYALIGVGFSLFFGALNVIHFAHGATHLLEMVAEAGGDVIGLDWRCDLDAAWRRVGYEKAVQGNIDPITLFAQQEFIRKRVQEILDRAGGRNGHIMNLGHGILKETPIENAEIFINATHELSKR